MAIAVFDFAAASRKVTEVLREELPQDTIIKTDEGWQGRVHVRVISAAFDGRNEQEKQDYIWDILKARLGPEAQSVSLVLAYGIEEVL